MASPISVFSNMGLYSVYIMATRYGMEVWGYRPWWRPCSLHPPDHPWAIQSPVNWKIILFPEGKAAGACLSQPTPRLGSFKMSRFILCVSKRISPSDIYLYLRRGVGPRQGFGLHCNTYTESDLWNQGQCKASVEASVVDVFNHTLSF